MVNIYNNIIYIYIYIYFYISFLDSLYHKIYCFMITYGNNDYLGKQRVSIILEATGVLVCQAGDPCLGCTCNV